MYTSSSFRWTFVHRGEDPNLAKVFDLYLVTSIETSWQSTYSRLCAFHCIDIVMLDTIV